ncbi:MAG: ABC transporter substrate-binding protein [Bacteroidaceae bacterium]|nr:ABC transporter substrate-binding protein [Bacteroidaceae bacterium]
MQKNIYRKFGVYLIGFLALMACTRPQTGTSEVKDSGFQPIQVKYARNFVLEDSIPGLRLLTICNAEGKHSTAYRYALVNGDGKGVDIPDGYEVIKVPVNRFICMTSLQLSNFIALNITDKVVGITSTRHLFNDALNQQIDDGRTVKIGIEGEFDNELVLLANPELIMVSPSKRGGFDVLKESGMPIMPHLGYQEPDPLGQAEWVKVIGILTGHEQEATAYFDKVEARYNELKEKVQCSTPNDQRPSIFSGDMKGGAWYATGGKSFLAAIFRDAGARYVLENNQDAGGVNMDFEAIYAQAADVDYWRISNSFNGTFTYDVLAEQDSRFCDFKAYRLHHVIYSNMSQTPFYESFPVHPDLVLSDFVKIFYPQLLPDYTPTYYKLLE